MSESESLAPSVPAESVPNRVELQLLGLRDLVDSAVTMLAEAQVDGEQPGQDSARLSKVDGIIFALDAAVRRPDGVSWQEVIGGQAEWKVRSLTRSEADSEPTPEQ